jgi:monoamine oxidase
MGFSRREFLMRVGQAGEYSAAFITMQSIGLFPAPVAAAEPLHVAPDIGKGVKVVILGGGIAGLVAAYELRALGYQCTVLEARSRPGGRNWTVRGGDKVTFLDGQVQQCSWDAGNYQNVGPARLPSIHKTMLRYASKLDVELQIEVNTTRSSFLQNDLANGGKPIVQRQAINDTRGHISELLMKCVSAGNLDQEISKEDRERMLAFLRMYGPLDAAGKYRGSDRAGYSTPPGAGDDAGVFNQPIDMHTLLAEGFWQGLLFEEMFDQQATMFQPVGGMDRIPYAFAKALGDIIKYDSAVTEINKTEKGVRITYKHGDSPSSIEADYCICAMPLTILKNTPNDLSAPYKKVIDDCVYAHAYKVAWESRRFWEQDYNIFGGLEFAMEGPSPVWFPSGSLFKQRGVSVSGYTDAFQTPFESLTFDQKLDASRKSVERLHPGHSREMQKPIYINWGMIPYNEGSWIRSYGPGQNRPFGAGGPHAGGPLYAGEAAMSGFPDYETLIQPDGPIYFAGDHVSDIVGWQEGAALSSLRAVKMISDRVKVDRLTGSAQPVAG